MGKVTGTGAGECEAGDAHRGIAGVVQGDGLSRTGCAHHLAGEGEAGGGKAHSGRRTRAGEADALRAAGGVVGEGDGCAARSTRSGLKGDADRAVGSGRHACPAIIGLSKVAGVGARNRQAGNAQGRVARVRQSDRLGRTRRADGLVAKSQAGGGETDYRRGAGAGPRESDSLGTSTGAVGDGQRGRPAAAGGGLKGHAHRATGARCQGAAAGVGLGKVAGTRAGECEADDAHRGIAGIVQGDGLSRAGCAHHLAGEREAGGGKAHSGRRAGPGEADGLWAAGGVVGESDSRGARPAGGRRKGHTDRAIGPCRQRTTAIIALGKVAGVGASDREASEAQGRVARVRQSDRLGRTRRADGLVAKSQAGGGETDYRRGAGAGPRESDSLGTSTGAVRDG